MKMGREIPLSYSGELLEQTCLKGKSALERVV